MVPPLIFFVDEVVSRCDPDDGSEASLVEAIHHVADAACPHPSLTGVGWNDHRQAVKG